MVTARAMWSLIEPLHAVSYFAPQARAATDAVGYRGFWMGYWATRVAPLGAVGPEVAAAAFFGFSPTRARRALPDAWTHASPERALEARLRGADQALATAWDPLGDGLRLEEAAELLEQAARSADTGGRVLAAGNAALPTPEGVRRRIWQAATTLREHRGDGHNAILVAAGISPVQAHLLKEAAGETDALLLRTDRAWPDEAWSTAADGLRARGWTTGDGVLTEAGVTARADVEQRTDDAAASPWRALGEAGTTELAALLRPLARGVIASGAYPVPNPAGAPAPA